jgi:hypothetical protein
MGIPEVLGSPYTVFPRTFRFLFVPKKNPDLQYLVSKVTIDFYQKQMDAFIMEAAPALECQDWIINMVTDRDYVDDYTLLALDGCGNRIYTLDFTGVKGIWHSVEYDYAKSDVVSHHVGFEYEGMTRTKAPMIPPTPLDPKLVEKIAKNMAEKIKKSK